MTIPPEKLKNLIRAVAATRPDEIGCDECFQQVDVFVEQVIAGKPSDAAMQLVEQHLTMCTSCQEEYQALLDALQLAQDEK